MAIRVTVADDQAVVRAGIAAILDAEPDLCVVGQAADGDTAVELALSARPDVALMDVRMPGIGGLAATAAIIERSPATRVLVLTTFGLDEYLFAALRAGAAGSLLKDAEPERVIDAVRVVHGGAALLDPAVTRTLIDRFTDGPGPLDTTRLDAPAPGDGGVHLRAGDKEPRHLLAAGLRPRQTGGPLGHAHPPPAGRGAPALGARPRVPARRPVTGPVRPPTA
ncbi:response regulator transcription factor [Streptomyces sparsogenes]|uniref:response regulator n=1 Tax=Streptomyces sparsogenes TaxID=67365 RepID=UPI0034092DD6